MPKSIRDGHRRPDSGHEKLPDTIPDDSPGGRVGEEELAAGRVLVHRPWITESGIAIEVRLDFGDGPIIERCPDDVVLPWPPTESPHWAAPDERQHRWPLQRQLRMPRVRDPLPRRVPLPHSQLFTRRIGPGGTRAGPAHGQQQIGSVHVRVCATVSYQEAVEAMPTEHVPAWVVPVTTPSPPWWGEGPEPASSWSDPASIKSGQLRHYQRLSSYASRWPSRDGEDLLSLSEHSVCSQNGEDGVIAEILSQIGVTNRTFIEFGVENGSEGNCVCLSDHRGWSGWFLEADPDHYQQLAAKYVWHDRVRTTQALVTAETVNDLFGGLEVPAVVDVLSIDIDGQDWRVWRALTITRPRLVVVEYNSAVDPALAVVPRDSSASWDGSQNYGSSLGAMVAVAAEKGYDLVYLESCGVNAFFVDQGVHWRGPSNAEVIRRTPNYFMTRKHHPGFDPSLGHFIPLPPP